MRNNTILLSRNDVIYKETAYDLDYFIKNIGNKKKRNIVIIGEEIYVKVHDFCNKEKLKVDKIELLIKKYFGNIDNYLIDYKISKDKKKMYIYAIRGGSFVERLCKAPILVNIIPIQLDFVRLCNKIIKKKNYVYFFEFRNLYYYIHIKDGYLIEGLVKSDFEEIKEVLKDIDEVVYIDNDIKYKIQGNKINIKERSIYNEKV